MHVSSCGVWTAKIIIYEKDVDRQLGQAHFQVLYFVLVEEGTNMKVYLVGFLPYFV